MITVFQASQIIQSHPLSFPVESYPLDEAIGGILAEAVYADRDFPAYNRVAMDGIAIRLESFQEGKRQFPVKGVSPAGMPQQTLSDPHACMEVMTGTVCPQGANAVIPYEEIDFTERDGQKWASIKMESLTLNQNIHQQGSDRKKGSLLIQKGSRIDSPEISVAATAGYAELSLSGKPRIAIISTGDELVAVDQNPLPHQIRKSNSYSLLTALKQMGIAAESFHIMDDLLGIKQALDQMMEQFEVLILSGGVSKGKMDYVPEALDQLGVEKLFHRVKQRPGKPFWFGRHEARKRVVFALPGNPVSTFVNFRKYVVPWLQLSMGIPNRPGAYARLSEDFTFNPDLTYFLQVQAVFDDHGVLWAKPIAGGGSGDHANLLRCNGFLELPRGQSLFKEGVSYPFLPYRNWM